ncbi:MAG: hypothetical protein H0X44_09580, partial [Acidobacteria bacterium]|nr:hypothetical protein [Acidobacteriota bacterium]
MRDLRLPLETREPIYDMGARFVANLEAPLAPHVFFLTPLGDHLTVVLSTVLMSWVCVYGCFRLARRLELGAVAFTLLTLLIAFNGSIVAHVGSGHLSWLGCYLLPLLIEGLIVMSAGGAAARRAGATVALVLFALVVMGSAPHIGVLSGALIAICAISMPAAHPALGLCLTQAAALSMFRVLPAGVTFIGGGRTWIADGYAPRQVLEGLLLLRGPDARDLVSITRAYGVRDAVPLGWVEFDVYIGIVGTLFIAVFGVLAAIRHIGPAPRHEVALRTLQIPCLILAGLSVWRFYVAMIVAPVSLLSVARVPSRFLGVAVIVAVVLVAARFDAWWRSGRRQLSEVVCAWAVVVAAAAQLAYHADVPPPSVADSFRVRRLLSLPSSSPSTV